MSDPLKGVSGVLGASHPLCRFGPRSICSMRTDPTGGFYLRTLSFSRPTTIMGPILDMVVVSCTLEVVVCEE
jgi:hypothetical protein